MNEVYEMNEILTIFGSFIVGIIVGFVIYHFAIGKSKVSTQQEEIDKTKSELEQYKAKVNSHFTNTAELMGEVASGYQSLYKHMADQSQDLLSDADLTPFPY
ncbi:YhcB family protein [Psychromonas sp. KJ10-10]|uniref:YhcB family protein n=1 Tax=Psychromonas sp. KJ10-10 TaxID=3391823 RepID=UPI0039B609C2